MHDIYTLYKEDSFNILLKEKKTMVISNPVNPPTPTLEHAPYGRTS